MSSGVTAKLHGYYRWHARLYDATRWAFLFGRTTLVRFVAEQLRPRRVLEIGCGTGSNLVKLARAFPDAEVVGLDLSAEMLAVARKKVEAFGPRLRLLEGVYDAPVCNGDAFDLIVFSYCLTMINPGYVDVLRLSLEDLAPDGHLAVVDFHDTPFAAFRSWMGINHVRMDGQVLAALQESELRLGPCQVTPAYGGTWRWLLCLARR